MLIVVQGCAKKEPETSIVESEQSRTLSEQSKTIKELTDRVSKLEVNNITADFMKKFDSQAYLETGENSFQALKTNVGYLTVNIRDVTPYANGSKVKLVFGNPLTAQIKDIKFTITYGSYDKSKLPKEEKTKEISLPTVFYSGKWNSVDIILEGIPTAELAYMKIENFTFGIISLLK